MIKKVIVVEYDPEWPREFVRLRSVFEKTLGSDFTEILHVGSTSVPGLKAKPVLDIDIVIEDDDKKLQHVIENLQGLDYIYAGDLGITGREAFNRKTEKTPDDGSGSRWNRHNLYVCKIGNIRFTKSYSLQGLSKRKS